MMSVIQPSFNVELQGYSVLGRGPSETGAQGGWPRTANLYYRCAACGDLMCADRDDYFSCRCGAMRLDIDAGRFGSRHGDENILVYRKKFTAYELRPQATYRVIAAFVDYDNEMHPVGERWRFLRDSFLPYEDGLSLFVEQDGGENQIRLQCRNEAQNDIVQAFSDYVVEERGTAVNAVSTR
jgi:hypothetical protein